MNEVQSASLRVGRAILEPRSDPKEYYDDVVMMVGNEVIQPVVFWRKWFQHPGLQKLSRGYQSVALDHVLNQSVIFVHCHGSSNGYLTDGLRKASERQAQEIYVLTSSFQFTDEELMRLQRDANEVFVTHSFEQQRHRIETHCPDRFSLFPHVTA